VIFAEHFIADRMILRRMVAKWWWITLCAFSLDHFVFSVPFCTMLM